jgi:protein-S-isoprenylcysteine O-methyltransferase Ste14
MLNATQILILAIGLAIGVMQFYWRRRNNLRRRVIRKGFNYYGDIVANNLLVLILLIELIFPRFISFANWSFSMVLITVGYIVAYLGLMFYLWCQVSMGKDWSEEPTVWEDQNLVTRGPFKFIRHPMYLSFILIGIGVALATHNWLIVVFGLLHYSLVISRAPYEEELMRKKFGQQYEEYIRKTGMFLPKIWQ